MLNRILGVKSNDRIFFQEKIELNHKKEAVVFLCQFFLVFTGVTVVEWLVPPSLRHTQWFGFATTSANSSEVHQFLLPSLLPYLTSKSIMLKIIGSVQNCFQIFSFRSSCSQVFTSYTPFTIDFSFSRTRLLCFLFIFRISQMSKLSTVQISSLHDSADSDYVSNTPCWLLFVHKAITKLSCLEANALV